MRKEDITYQDKYGELILDISHPNSKNINFIFVEGGSDIKLFRKLFDLEKCKVEDIPGDNQKLEECVENLVQKSPLVIGIRDSDFIKLNPIPYTKKNMFLTDYHDIEMTILAETTVLNALLFEFTSYPKEKHVEFKDNMMNTIMMMGCLKWLNDKEDLTLKFSVGFQNLISFDNYEINFDEYLNRILSKSKNAKLKDKNIINEKIDNLLNLNPNLMQLTNGHDLLNTFAKFFREKTGHKGLTEEHIAIAFRMTYTVEHFYKTNLYTDLQIWATQNNTNLFFDS